MATAAEVSSYLGVPLKTLSNWRYLSQGPPWVKVGKHIRYPWPDVDRWVAEHMRVAS
jgi:hypothetical protein